LRTIVPSVLTKDPKDLEKKVRILEQYADTIQIDIMDDKLVPNTSVKVADVEKANLQKPMEFTLHCWDWLLHSVLV